MIKVRTGSSLLVHSSGDEIDRCFIFYIDAYGVVDRHRFIAEPDLTFYFVLPSRI
jgi:hypothetical protein